MQTSVLIYFRLNTQLKFELKMKIIFCVTLSVIFSHLNADSNGAGLVQEIGKAS